MSVNIFTNGLLSKVAGNYTTDLQMSSTSNNPVANSVVKNYIDSKSSNSVLYYATEAEMDQDWVNIPEGATISTPDGSEELIASAVKYNDGSQQGSNVQSQIDSLWDNLTPQSVFIMTQSSETYSQAFTRLANLVNFNKLEYNSTLILFGNVYHVIGPITSNSVTFSRCNAAAAGGQIRTIVVSTTSSQFYMSQMGQSYIYNDWSSQSVDPSVIITLNY